MAVYRLWNMHQRNQWDFTTDAEYVAIY